MANDGIQHGIDDNPHGDAEKGAVGGAVGGAVVGALAGGPVGAVIGAVAGGLASGVGVAAVDRVDNDNTVSGVGDGVTPNATSTGYATTGVAPVGGHNVVTGGPAVTDDGKTGLGAGAVAGGVVGAAVGGPVGAVVGGALGSLAGGVAGDATEAADRNVAGTGYTSSTVGTVEHTAHTIGTDVSTTAHNFAADVNADLPGNKIPGVQTGGVTTAGADTRGITEKAADVLTGDRTDDKTGGQVL